MAETKQKQKHSSQATYTYKVNICDISMYTVHLYIFTLFHFLILELKNLFVIHYYTNIFTKCMLQAESTSKYE